jgi:hypothetical protein
LCEPGGGRAGGGDWMTGGLELKRKTSLSFQLTGEFHKPKLVLKIKYIGAYARVNSQGI